MFLFLCACVIFFTPLEKATDFSRWSSPYKADGGLTPPSAQTVRERSSLTGFTTAVFALDEQIKPEYNLPFIGKIKIDNVNIRAGASQNFEILAKLNSDDLVIVREESYGWYKISLPKTAYCYVWKDYIQQNGTVGVSRVSNLNLRARPSRDSSVVGQLAKGASVTILNQDSPEWYQISSEENCYGWVKVNLVEYYSSIKDKSPQQTDINYTAVSLELQPPFAKGKVEKIWLTFTKNRGNYRLMENKQLICYLKSDKYNLKDFEGKTVLVWGNRQQAGHDKPLVVVQKIEIVK